MRIAILLAGALLATACSTTTASYPVEVTRYRADNVGRGTIALVPADARDTGSLEFRAYADAVGDALSKQGYTVVAPAGDATYIALIEVRADQRQVRTRSPFSIGLGGGSYSGGYGGGVGVGGGVSIPIGSRTKTQVATTLSVKINTRDGMGVWEGRAQSQEVRNPGTGITAISAARVANALFTGFPGESGRTISVK